MSSKRTSARLRSAARARMKETGENYTAALAALSSDELAHTRLAGVPSDRRPLGAVLQLINGSVDQDDAHVYLWARDLVDFEGAPVFARALEIEAELPALLDDARDDDSGRVIVVIDDQGALSSSSADALLALRRDRADVEIVYAERNIVSFGVAESAGGRDLIAGHLAPAPFGIFGAADEIIASLRADGADVVKGGTYPVSEVVSSRPNYAKLTVERIITQRMNDRGISADDYNSAGHADAVIESLVAAGVYFPEHMLTPIIKVDPKGSMEEVAGAVGGRVTVLGEPGHGFTSQVAASMKRLFPDEGDDQIRDRLVADAAAMTLDIESPEHDALFGHERVVPLDTSGHGSALRAEAETYAKKGLPFVTLDTGLDRRYAAAEAINDYGVFALVITTEADYYGSCPLALVVHPEDLTAGHISPMIGYYVIDNVDRAVEDLNGMSLISTLVSEARSKGLAIRLLQSREADVPAAIAGSITHHISSEPDYGIIVKGKRPVSLRSEVYAHVFDDETGIDFTDGGHLLVTGATGSGKTVLVQEIVAQMRRRDHEVVISESPFAQYDYDEGTRDIHESVDYVHSLMGQRHGELVNRELTSALKAEDMPPVFLVIDEADYVLSSFPTSTPDERERMQRTRNKVTQLLRQSRSAGIHLVLFVEENYPNFAHIVETGLRSRRNRELLGIRDRGRPGDGTHSDPHGNIRRIHVRRTHRESGADRP